MKHLKSILLLLLTLFIINVNAQEIEHKPPTLQVGLDGINFSKGSLDPEIIARIVAEKQDEIKIKIIQNSFLKKIYGSGGTIYNYADNIIKGIVQESDTDVRTRKIMESTVNLVFVYAFVDFYLKEAHKKPIYQTNLENLAKGYKLTKLKDFKEGLNYRKLISTNNGLDTQTSRIEYKANKQINSGEKTKDDKLYKLIALLIDISSEVVRNDKTLRDLGLMRLSYSNNYDYLNKYKQQQNYLAFQKIDSEFIKESNKEFSRKVYDNMESFIKKYTSYIGALKFALDNKSFKSNSISKFIETSSFNTNTISNFFTKNNNTKYEYDSIKKNTIAVLEKLSDSYKKISETKKEHINENYLKDVETAINKLTASLDYIKKVKLYLSDIDIDVKEKVLIISDMLYTLKTEVIPNIEYSIKLAPELIKTKDAVIKLTRDLYLILVTNNKTKYLNNLSKDPEPFLKLVSKLYEFDKTKTFSEYTNLISLLDEIFESGKIKSALSTINTFVKDYTVITTDNEGNEYLVFNVESFLVKLNTIQSDKIRRFEFLFTVGINTTSFLNGQVDIGNNEKISNISHFSEKLGIKFKFINKGAWLPKNPGETYGSFGYNYIKTSPPKEPIISNFHALIYGSGILYNLINSSTNKEFNYPMVGAGLGLTFYNSLDFNVSIGMPILETGGFQAMKDNAFINFGFDIQIGEYLKGVGKKRKIKKQNELLMSKNKQ